MWAHKAYVPNSLCFFSSFLSIQFTGMLPEMSEFEMVWCRYLFRNLLPLFTIYNITIFRKDFGGQASAVNSNSRVLHDGQCKRPADQGLLTDCSSDHANWEKADWVTIFGIWRELYYHIISCFVLLFRWDNSTSLHYQGVPPLTFQLPNKILFSLLNPWFQPRLCPSYITLIFISLSRDSTKTKL